MKRELTPLGVNALYQEGWKNAKINEQFAMVYSINLTFYGHTLMYTDT